MLEGFIEVTPILRCGVYALQYEGEVVYIGQSKRMLNRVAAHFTNWGKNTYKGRLLPARMLKFPPGMRFDRVFVLPCRVEDLNELERAMIDLYKPRYNVRLKSPDHATVAMVLTVGKVSVPFNHRPSTPPFERRI